MNEQSEPYKDVGNRIKMWREKWGQTLRDVSNSLEIDLKTLKSIESGQVLPDDDQLDMFMSHFLMSDDQANELLDLVETATGRKNNQNPAMNPFGGDPVGQIMMMVLSSDTKIAYTDGMNASVDDKGVVLEFTQRSPDSKNFTVSRLGMSHEHAEQVAIVINETISKYRANKNSLKSISNKSDKTDNKHNSKKSKDSKSPNSKNDEESNE
jgi:hypothetical protein